MLNRTTGATKGPYHENLNAGGKGNAVGNGILSTLVH